MIDGAKTCRLLDVLGIQGGYPFRGAVASVPSGPVFAVQMKDLSGGRVTWQTVTRTDLPERPLANWLQAGDILFVCRGPSFYAACVEQVPGRAVCSPHLFLLRAKAPDRLDASFLAWLINQPPVQRQLAKGAEGSNQLSIRRAVLEHIEIRLPPMADQRRIAAMASAAQRERELLEQLIQGRQRELAAIAEDLSAS